MSVRAPDAYVRIRETELRELRVEHLASAVDPSIAVPREMAAQSAEVITGYTEWEGTWRGTGVTLGWDWALLRGRVRLLSVAEIRTNIQVVSRDGTVRSPDASRGLLARWIETLPWRAVATHEAARGEL
jgi:Domain of unknown function (DUF4902)